MTNKTELAASIMLGKRVSASEHYDPSLLVAIPRYENRIQYNIEQDNTPFEGCDIWHAYEFSALTKNNIPVTRLMKIKYSCCNDFLVESKSLKLYLNSFNMTSFGSNVEECLALCKKIIEKDLSEKLKTDVKVNFLDDSIQSEKIFSDFKNLMDYVNQNTIKIERFKESPELIEFEEKDEISKHSLYFDSLRSNCRVTHQPDFGDVFIYYKSKKYIKEESLVKYLCSFRCEYHFHEECCEMIYKRLYDLLDKDDELLVCALYTRRGGIDICPIRHSRNLSSEDISKLADITKFARKSIKQ